MLLLDSGLLDERRRAATGPLAGLYDSLELELRPLLGADPRIPAAKALLSRAGGRCERDGASLDFDPASPHAHRCPVCGTVHTGELHDRAWVTSYQLWLAERSVHAALCHLLRGGETHATLARDILRAYADRYLDYPNRDNVLGPTRLFFSTYLESIWLLQICVAADLLAESGDRATADLVRDRIVEPSSALIAGYDESLSNRQVWNNAALLASAALRGDDAAFDRILEARSGVRAHLTEALLPDGTWYEGENYHQFALRGLWYGVVLSEARGRRLETALEARFRRAFAAPFVTALPDFTMPSRKDSQYAVSLRQWRLAELTELGFARSRDPVLASALARCYEAGHHRRDTGRARSTADVERNGPSTALTRSDLGWRALLHALPELPPVTPAPMRSALLEGQGIGIFRRADDIYVALDYGQSGGGHGHPDRLNVLLSQGEIRWLDDLGTGSYVDPSLHWYRSTLAHNAPLVNGQSQEIRDGVLRAYDEREGLGWIHAELTLPGTGTRLERSVLVAPDYLVDELRWTGPPGTRVELPWHLDAECQTLTATFAPLDGGDGLEDGFTFARDSRVSPMHAGLPVMLEARLGKRDLRAHLVSEVDASLWFLCGPGQPAAAARRFVLMRADAATGSFRAVLTWAGDIQEVRFTDGRVDVLYANGEQHLHRHDDAGWHVELRAGGARSSIDLAGHRPMQDQRQRPLKASRTPAVVRRGLASDGWLSELSPALRQSLVEYELGEKHYRRSEDSWSAAGGPRATVAFAATSDRMIVFVKVRAGDLHFPASEAINPFDNEHPDTMGAGVQLYLRTPDRAGGWTLVPESGGGRVRIRAIRGWGSFAEPAARWRECEGGYETRIEVPLPLSAATEYPVDVDVIVNETTATRARRRGQLVLSGAADEFVYLRGDRHDATRLIPLVIVS